MRMTSVVIAVAVLLGTMEGVGAGPILLASYDLAIEGGHAPEDEPRVEFILQLPSELPPLTSAGLGTGRDVFWEDGSTGLLDYTSVTDDAFDDFAAAVTDGIEDNFIVWDLFPSGGGGGTPALSESVLFGAWPDLVGYELKLVRLIVHNIAFQPWIPDPMNEPGIEGFRHQAQLTYEFYGASVPEPHALVLLTAGTSLILVRRERRRAQRKDQT